MTDYSNVVPARIALKHTLALGYDVSFLNLTENGRVYVSVDRHIGNMASPAECNGRTQTWKIAGALYGACIVDVAKLRSDLSDGGALSVLLDRVHAGHTVDWNGREYSGGLDADASAASAEISRLMRRNGNYYVARFAAAA